jgi:hypothetical protein
MERGTELASIRQLRDLTSLGYLDAKLALCKYYARGKYGGISQVITNSDYTLQYHERFTTYILDELKMSLYL